MTWTRRATFFDELSFGTVGDFGSNRQFALFNYRDTAIIIDSVLFGTSSFSTNPIFSRMYCMSRPYTALTEKRQSIRDMCLHWSLASPQLPLSQAFDSEISYPQFLGEKETHKVPRKSGIQRGLSNPRVLV